jgi:predicted RNase H-like nuclease
MKKIFLVTLVLLFCAPAFAQRAPKEVDPEIKELQMARDTIKATLKIKNSENTKDYNKRDKLINEKAKLRDQLSAAKKAKKTDKVDTIQEKITENMDAIKELDLKLKEDNKELDKLDKDLKNAERELQRAKDRIAKEKKK